MIQLPEKVRPQISRNRAYCLLALIPARAGYTASGVYLGETPEHWERITSDGHVVRCHTHVEALNAWDMMQDYVANGQFKRVEIAQYDPQRSDLPYGQWVRGIRGKLLGKLGISERDLPEEQDPDLQQLSDDEWLARGPR